MKRMSWLLGVCLVIACGGTAVVDGDNGFGGSGSGTGTTTTATGTGSGTTTGTGTGTGTTTGVPNTLCEQACASIANCQVSPDPGCVTRCGGNGSGCDSLHDSFLSCYLGTTDGAACSMNSICGEDVFTWLDCIGAAPLEYGCFEDSTGNCGCEAGVNGDDGPYLETACSKVGNSYQCACLVDGQVVGECSNPNAQSQSCDPFYGCCASLFFVGY